MNVMMQKEEKRERQGMLPKMKMELNRWYKEQKGKRLQHRLMVARIARPHQDPIRFLSRPPVDPLPMVDKFFN